MSKKKNKKGTSRLREAVVFDFDNTMCDVRAIEHLIDHTDRWFTAFHELTHTCPPVAAMVLKAQQARAEGKVVVIATARRQRWMESIVLWAKANGVHIDAIFMRGDDDDRPDDVMKSDLFDRIERRFKITHFYDDRKMNYEMALARGLQATLVRLEDLEKASIKTAA